MIYFKSFRNYESFKEVFGLRECGNGNTSRTNKILLGCLTNKDFFKFCVSHKEYVDYLSINNMADFKRNLFYDVSRSSLHEWYRKGGSYEWEFVIDGQKYTFYVNNMEMDGNHGICDDGDTRAIRYRNVEADRIYKMKAGKFFTKVLEGCEFGRILLSRPKAGWVRSSLLPGSLLPRVESPTTTSSITEKTTRIFRRFTLPTIAVVISILA